MPPPYRPGEGTPEGIVRRIAYTEATRRCKNSGNESGMSMSDMTWAMMEAFKALNDAGFDIVDRRTGKPVPYEYGHLEPGVVGGQP